jgi:hypothetical protein
MKMYRSEPLTEKEKAYLRRLNGVKSRFAVDTPLPDIKKVREYSDTIKVELPKRRKLGTSGSRLDPRIRAIVEARAAVRADMRRALQDVIDGKKGDLPI